MSVKLRRTLVVAGAAALAVGVISAPASAHVTANAVNATQGGYTVVAFRVPTERENAATTKVRVEFPASDPLASVAVRPDVRWTYRVTKRTIDPPIVQDGRTISQVVSAVEWTSLGSLTSIKPGEFDEFQVSVGPLPAKDSITFRAIQTYSSGEQVVWTPGLRLAPPAGQPAGQPSNLMQNGLPVAQAAPLVTSEPDSDGLVGGAFALGGLGLLAGLTGVGLALTTRRRYAPRG